MFGKIRDVIFCDIACQVLVDVLYESDYTENQEGEIAMAEKEFRKSLAVFPIGTVMTLTGLSARQIRYYETHELVVPTRSETNRRLYSLNDVDRLLEIIDLIAEGYTLQGIKKRWQQPVIEKPVSTGLTDQDVRRILWDELDIQGRFN